MLTEINYKKCERSVSDLGSSWMGTNNLWESDCIEDNGFTYYI
jgi:hypothetical protein